MYNQRQQSWPSNAPPPYTLDPEPNATSIQRPDPNSHHLSLHHPFPSHHSERNAPVVTDVAQRHQPYTIWNIRPNHPDPQATRAQRPGWSAEHQEDQGRQNLIELVERFINCRFSKYPNPSNTNRGSHFSSPKFSDIPNSRERFQMCEFIRCALSLTTKGHTSDTVVYHAMLLLQRVWDRLSYNQIYPLCPRSQESPQVFRKELFLSAFIIAHSYHCDAIYHHSGWSMVSLNLFSSAEIKAMAGNMCAFLEYDVSPGKQFDEFCKFVKEDFSKDPPRGFYHPIYDPKYFSSNIKRGVFQLFSLNTRWGDVEPRERSGEQHDFGHIERRSTPMSIATY